MFDLIILECNSNAEKKNYCNGTTGNIYFPPEFLDISIDINIS
jgi:hypothetical protein